LSGLDRQKFISLDASFGLYQPTTVDQAIDHGRGKGNIVAQEDLPMGKTRCVVTTMELRSYRLKITWERSSGPCLPMDRRPSPPMTSGWG